MLASISALPIADTKEGESVVFPLRSLGRVLGVEVHFGYYTTPRDLHEICDGCRVSVTASAGPRTGSILKIQKRVASMAAVVGR